MQQLADKEKNTYMERGPRVEFIIIYIFCAIPLFFIQESIAFHVERSSHTGFYIGLVVWLFAFWLVIKYYFLPDSAIVRLKKQGKIVIAEVIGDSHSTVSGLPPLLSHKQGAESAEQLRKRYADRQIKVRFHNLSDTLITQVFSLPVDYFSASLEQIIKKQNQSLAIERSAINVQMPVWQNTQQISPAFALANEHGRVTSLHLKVGFCLIIITLLQMILPLMYVAHINQHLRADVLTLFNTATVWQWAPICNIVVLWICHSHGSVEPGPNGIAVDVIRLSGLSSTTESISWKQTHYSSDDPAYRVDVTYKDSTGQLQELHFTDTVPEALNYRLESMPQRRPILYLDEDKDKIIFVDREDGQFV